MPGSARACRARGVPCRRRRSRRSRAPVWAGAGERSAGCVARRPADPAAPRRPASAAGPALVLLAASFAVAFLALLGLARGDATVSRRLRLLLRLGLGLRFRGRLGS